MDIERHNRRQIEQFNQRGGRMLRIVDLLQAGTKDRNGLSEEFFESRE